MAECKHLLTHTFLEGKPDEHVKCLACGRNLTAPTPDALTAEASGGRYEEAPSGVKGDMAYRCRDCGTLTYSRRDHDERAHTAPPPTPRRPAMTATEDGAGEDALASVIDPEAFEDDWFDDVETARKIASAILASDWLRDREAAAANRGRVEGLREVRLIVGMSGHRFYERGDHAAALDLIDESLARADSPAGGAR